MPLMRHGGSTVPVQFVLEGENSEHVMGLYLDQSTYNGKPSAAYQTANFIADCDATLFSPNMGSAVLIWNNTRQKWTTDFIVDGDVPLCSPIALVPQITIPLLT